MYTHAQHTQCIHAHTCTPAHTCTHTHTMHTCTHMHPHTHNAYMHTQGGASINRTARLFGKGEGGPHIWPKTKAGGGGGGGRGSLAIRHQTRGIDQPPWLQACIYTHMAHMHIHTYTRIHTHNAHINTHARVYVYSFMCIHKHTYTEILLDSKYTLREVRFFAIGTTQKSCIA